MDIQDLRNLTSNEEIDYVFLMAALRDYKCPRNKIARWIKNGDLIRIKKGIYTFSDRYQRRPVDTFVLANMIYGPSYVSLESALSHHGMIPEKVVAVTSVALKRSVTFDTPIGRFSYSVLAKHRYTVGLDWIRRSEQQGFLIACAEKALCDQLFVHKYEFITPNEIEAALLEDLRIDEEKLAAIDFDRLAHIAKSYRSRLINRTTKWICKEFG